MKKLLTGAVAGLALIFGFASCSGDMHDYVADADHIGLYVAGDLQGESRPMMKFVDANTQTYTFKYDGQNAWSSPAGTVQFKIANSAGTDDWGGKFFEFGWKKDETKLLTLNDEFVELEARSGTNSNPGNLKLENLINGQEYTIIIDYDAPAKKAKVKVTGLAINIASPKIILKGATAAEDELKAMTMIDAKTFDYTFETENDNKDIEFAFKVGTIYFTPDSPKELAAYTPYETDDNSDEGFELIDYYKYTAAKAGNHKIRINCSYGDDGDVKAAITVTCDPHILGLVAIEGPFNEYNNNKDYPTIVDGETAKFEFTTTEELKGQFEFSILEKAGEWWPRWYAGTTGKSPKIVDDIVAKKTVSGKEVEGTSQVVIYETSELEYGKDNNIKITGLPYVEGKKFVITIKVEDESKKELSISCAPKEGETFTEADYTPSNKYSLKGLTLKGSWKCSWWGNQFTLTEDKKQSYLTQIGATPCDEHESQCAAPENLQIQLDSGSSKEWKLDSALALGTRTKLTYDPGNGSTNITVTETNVRKYPYIITVELENDDKDNPEVYITVSKYTLEGSTLKGGWEGWWADTHVFTADDNTAAMTTEGFSWTTSAPSAFEHAASGNELGIFFYGKESKNVWGGDLTGFDVETSLDYSVTAADEEKPGVGSAGNNKITGQTWEEKQYKITVKLDMENFGLKMTVTELES